MATYPNNSGAAGLFILWLGVAQFAFALLCLLVRQELAAEPAIDELVMPRVIRATIAGTLLAALVIGGRSAVRVWSARHRRRSAA